MTNVCIIATIVIYLVGMLLGARKPAICPAGC